jgi:hypothetical protein
MIICGELQIDRVTPRERELLQGMGNCFAVCGEDFEGTTRMVASARGLEQDEVIQTLKIMRKNYGGDQDYKELRTRLPEDFPL